MRNEMTHFLVASWDAIKKAKNDKEVISDDHFVKMTKAEKDATKFISDIENSGKAIFDLIKTLRIDKANEKPRKTSLLMITFNCVAVAKSIVVIPLSDMMNLEAYKNKANENPEQFMVNMINGEMLTEQKLHLDTQGVFIAVRCYRTEKDRADGNVNSLIDRHYIVSKNDMAMISSMMLIMHFKEIIRYEMAKRISGESEFSTIENIIEKHVDVDSKRTASFFAAALVRSFTRWTCQFPDLKKSIPSYLINNDELMRK